MDFEYSSKVKELKARVETFMQDNVYPNEEKILGEIAEGNRWERPPAMELLKAKARECGLWNLSCPRANLARASQTWSMRLFAR